MRKLIIPALAALVLLSGCAPVHMLTRLKKTPREYSENYPIEGIKAPKSEAHKKPWIVYSDRADHAAFVNPGGKIKSAEVKFAEPFLVIGQKGEYLELIKYKPENIKDNRLNERKKAEYVGWMHRSRLLLSPTSITDIRSGLKDKMLTAITDSAVVFHPERYFAVADTLKVFADPALSKQSATLGLHQIVYVLKTSDDGGSALVTHSPDLSIDKASEQLIGWIPQIALQNIGRQLFSKTNLSEDYPQPALLKYSPVIRPYSLDSTMSFLSGVFSPIIDKTENKVYNIDGESISYQQSSRIKADLKRINVIFAIEPSSKLSEQYPLLLNVIQNFMPHFSSKDDIFEYRFGASVSTGATISDIPMTSDYNALIDSLTVLSTRIAKQPATKQQTWSALSRSLNLLKSDSLATNIVVVVGETADAQETAQSAIATRLKALNCRLLGVQTYASEENSYNNFVLQLTSMIDEYALYRNKKKRDITLFADQVRRENRFVEPVKNFYMLDYPARSMTQGAVLFPEKGADLSIELVSGAMDSLLTQVRSDNMMLRSSMDRAFTSVGSSKDKYDTRFATQFSMLQNSRLSDDFKKMYDGKSPVWYSKTGRISLSDSLMDYRLMLSEVELERAKSLLETLSAKEVDVKDRNKRKTGKSKNLCAYLEEMEQMTDEQIAALSAPQDSIATDPVYVSTRKIRKHITRLYLSELGQCRVCKKSTRQLRRMSLSQAHEQLFGTPSNLSLLDRITIKGLKKKKAVSDPQLDDLIRYFKVCKEQFEGKSADEKAASSTESYYYIDAKLLP